VSNEGGSLRHISYEPQTGWSAFDDRAEVLIGAPAAILWDPNRFDLFGIGTDNALKHTWFDGAWHEWKKLGDSLKLGVAASSFVAGGVHGCWGVSHADGLTTALIANCGGGFDEVQVLFGAFECMQPSISASRTITNPLNVGDAWYTTDGSFPAPENPVAKQSNSQPLPAGSSVTIAIWEQIGPPPAQIKPTARQLSGPVTLLSS